MKPIKLTSIIIATVAIFTACKKVSVINQNDSKNWISKKMTMNYHGETLEYIVKFTRVSENVIV